MNDSLTMAIEYVLNGTQKVTQLSENDLQDFAIQLFIEEEDKSDQVSMLIESDYFKDIPSLLISFVIPQDPYPSNNITSNTINSLIRDNLKDKIASTLVKCLVETYTIEMQRLLDFAIGDMEEINNLAHNDDMYTQHQESQANQ